MLFIEHHLPSVVIVQILVITWDIIKEKSVKQLLEIVRLIMRAIFTVGIVPCRSKCETVPICVLFRNIECKINIQLRMN